MLCKHALSQQQLITSNSCHGWKIISLYSSFLVNSHISHQRLITCKVIYILIFNYSSYDMRIKDLEQSGTFIFEEFYFVVFSFVPNIWTALHFKISMCSRIRIYSVFLRRHVIWRLLISNLCIFSYYTSWIKNQTPCNLLARKLLFKF